MRILAATTVFKAR